MKSHNNIAAGPFVKIEERNAGGSWSEVRTYYFTAISGLQEISIDFTPTKEEVRLYLSTSDPSNSFNPPTALYFNNFSLTDGTTQAIVDGGIGSKVAYEARIYNASTGRWLARDPLVKKFPSMSPFNAFGNNPILFYDPDGKDLFIGGKTAVALNDIKSLVPEEYRSQIKVVDNNKIVFEGFEDLPDNVKAFEGVSLLNKLIKPGTNFKLTVGNEVLVRERMGFDGTNNGVPGDQTFRLTTDDTKTSNDVFQAVDNISKTARSDIEDGGLYPEEGFDGSVRISDGEFTRKNSFTGTGENHVERNTVVFHELFENFLRTKLKMDKDGDDGAHQRANDRANKFSKEVNKERDASGGRADGFKPRR